MNQAKIADVLKRGGIGILATDTIYGLVGHALNEKTVERIYRIRQRRPDKPFIVLIADLSDLEKFNVKIEKATEEILARAWPGKVSVILSCQDQSLAHLHRGQDLAVRLPDKNDLRELIRAVGPLVAPSANPEGLPPAKNIAEAKKYFGVGVDFYEDSGELISEPSTLIKIVDGKIEVIRPGAVKF